MKAFVVMLILSQTVFSQIQFLSYSQNVTRRTAVKVLDIKNSDGEFYRRTSTTILTNGKIAVLDIGNNLLKIFSKEGHFIQSFGRKGQGPGEFYGLDKIYSINNTLFVRSNYKLSFFTDTGEHIRDVQLLVHGQVGNPVVYNNKVYIFFKGNSILSHIILDEKGVEVNRLKNKNYEKNGIKEDDTILLHSSIRVLQMGNYIYKAAYGLFDLKMYNSDFEIISEYALEMNPIKRNPQKIIDNMRFDPKLTGKALKKAKLYELNLMLKEISIYENGIKSLVGFFEDKIIIQINTKNKNELYLLIIQDNMIVEKLVIDNCYATEVRYEKNSLIVNKKDEYHGPEINLYKIN